MSLGLAKLRVPRLGRSRRTGVFYVRVAYRDASGIRRVRQHSLRTRDPRLARLRALHFNLEVETEDAMGHFPHSIARYEVETPFGVVRAEGPEDHQRALESLQSLQQLIKLQLEALDRQINSGAGVGPSGVSVSPQVLTQHAPAHPSLRASASAAPAAVRCPGSIKLKDALAQHLAEEERMLMSDRSVQGKRALFDEFSTFFGDVWLDELTQHEITNRWRPAEFKRKNQRNPDQTLSPVALQKRHGALSKFFKWAKDLGRYPYECPMGRPMATKREINRKRQSWKEFTSEDIQRLFCERFVTEMNKPDFYWGPIIALFSGARLGEIANLELSKFETIDGIKCWFIQSGKTNDSRRNVPLHPKLIELGLWDYVAYLRSQRHTHLFPHRPAEDRAKALGRMWGIWVSKCGIEDRAKVFHSFRPTAITDLYDSPAPNPAAIRTLVGHAGGLDDIHGGYVRGVKLQRIKEQVESLQFPSVDFATLRRDDPTFASFFAALKSPKSPREK